MKAEEPVRENVASRALIYLIIAGLAAGALSIGAVYSVTHQLYAAGYYTLSSLFDATGVDVGPALGASLEPFSPAFYLIAGVSALDGIVKIVIIGFVIAAVVNFIASIDIKAKLFGVAGHRLRNHVIVCGYSKLAEKLCIELAGMKEQFVVINRSQPKVDMVRDAGWLAVRNDFTFADALKSVSIDSASAVVFLTPDDYENLLGVITARSLNKGIKIISRGKDDSTITKIQRAGADVCVVPEVIAGLELGDKIVSRL